MFSHYVLFFKQKTANELRISDWSSDVCSSDLIHADQHGQAEGQCHAHVADAELVSVGPDHVRGQHRRSAASQYQPERAEKLGDKSFHHLGIPREWPAGGPGGMLEQVLAEDVRTEIGRAHV